MPNTIIPYAQFEFKSNQTYFFDNNIWISFYSFINNNPDKHRKVSSFLSKIERHNSQIALVSLIISEFTNTTIRLCYNLWKEQTQNYMAEYKRDYKQSTDFQNNLTEVKSLVRTMYQLDCTERYPDSFNAIALEPVMENFHIDFNDAYYLELCARNNWILVTSDNDFDSIDKGITIVKI